MRALSVSLSLSLCLSQLEDGHSLFDYDVGLNDIIQLIIRPAAVPLIDHTPSSSPPMNGETQQQNGERANGERANGERANGERANGERAERANGDSSPDMEIVRSRAGSVYSD